MPLEVLFQNFERYISLSAEEKLVVEPFLLQKSLPKKSIILHENQISFNATFVLSGCLKAYTIDNNGFEHIIQFAPSDWWVTDMYSFITQKPGNIYIESIEPSSIVQLSRADQLRLFDKIPRFERYFRIITENSLVAFRKRLMDNLSLSAAERYEGFCSRYPTLITKLPQKLVASYIGVTPEFLSKMKAAEKKKRKTDDFLNLG